jgi:hypothetical protein
MRPRADFASSRFGGAKRRQQGIAGRLLVHQPGQRRGAHGRAMQGIGDQPPHAIELERRQRDLYRPA